MTERHKTPPLQFLLLVDDFGVQYERQADITYLQDTLKAIYNISEDLKAIYTME